MGWQYSEKTKRLFLDAVQGKTGTHVGEVANADGVGEHGSVACGDALKFTFRVERDETDPTKDRVVEAKFLTFGCTSAIAASEALCRIVEERRPTPLEALKITNQDVVEFLEGLPTQKVHCSVMGAEALEEAVWNWAERRGVDMKALGYKKLGNDAEEGRVVCQCFGITEPYLRRQIRELGLKTVDDVTGALKAGGACGSCRGEIQNILDEVLSGSCSSGARPAPSGDAFDGTLAVVEPTKSADEPKKTGFIPLATVSTTAAGDVVQDPSFETTDAPKAAPGEFAKLSPYQKAKRIEETIENAVRPILRRDGGDIEIVDVKDDVVYVAMTGACDGCDAASQTLDLIVTTILQDRLDPNVRVVQL